MNIKQVANDFLSLVKDNSLYVVGVVTIFNMFFTIPATSLALIGVASFAGYIVYEKYFK